MCCCAVVAVQNRLESAVVHFLRPHSNQTCLATNQVVACCVNTDIRLDKISRESTNELRPCWKTSLLLAGKTRNIEWFCYEKSRTTHYFLQQLFATCNNLIIFAARQIWFRGGETRKSLFNSFCSNVSKTRCTFLLHRAKITKERNCLVCVASRIGVRQCFLEARNSPKWSQFHTRRSLVVFKKENTSQRCCWKEKKKS